MLQKIAQFYKRMRKIWGVWHKRVQCLAMGELKQIRILSLKCLIIVSLSLEYKEVLVNP
jgi:hypothetical protein